MQGQQLAVKLCNGDDRNSLQLQDREVDLPDETALLLQATRLTNMVTKAEVPAILLSFYHHRKQKLPKETEVCGQEKERCKMRQDKSEHYVSVFLLLWCY